MSTVITLPADLKVTAQSFGQRRFDIAFGNGDTGASQVAVLAPPRWLCSISSEERLSREQAAEWRAMVLSLQGRVNKLALYDLLNPAPAGTVRGTLTANADAAAGATSLAINAGSGQNGYTFNKGDWIGVHQGTDNRQLLHINAMATVSGGVVTVQFSAPLRVAVASGASVGWDKPTALFRCLSDTNEWMSREISQGGFSLDLMESWE